MPDRHPDEDKASPRPAEKEIFLAALEIEDPAEREAWLKEACGDDEGLHARVVELLEAEGEDGDDFLAPEEERLGEAVSVVRRQLEDEATDPEADTIASGAPRAKDRRAIEMLGLGIQEQPGTIIDRYKLLQKIGEGGGGVVYLAQQTEPVKRRVALKVIKLGMDTHQVVARFEAERQALAMMDHPNIAKVLDAGATETGRPYFVMELVRGTPITVFCDENNLSTVERLELFMQVCEAVQHAHQKGIIHRDLKPGNVLVTMLEDRPLPKVIDFGIAKATQQELTEKTLFTQHGHFIGTPAYMSPEQASMTGYDIDTRSDIYALGVLLYELLTGKTPFDTATLLQAGYDEIRRVIAEDDPPRPSTRLSAMDDREITDLAKHRRSEPRRLSRLVRGDLDWIVMKALEKDRRRRYETASGFAADIQRYLNDEVVTAGPPTLGYKLRKFARRNKAALAMTSAIALAVLAGTGVSIWQAVRASRNAKNASDAEVVAKAEAKNAREQEKVAKRHKREAEIETGKAWMERARGYAEQTPSRGFFAALMAGRAIGYQGYGREGHDERFAENFPIYSEGQEEDVRAARDLIAEQVNSVRPFWSSPIARQHVGGGRGLGITPDGRTFVSAGRQDIKVWDLESGELVRSWKVGRLEGAALSLDGETVVGVTVETPPREHMTPDESDAWARRATIQVWDVKSGRLRRALPAHGARVNFGATVATDSKGRTLACGVEGERITIWDLESGILRHSLRGHPELVEKVVMSPDGRTLVSRDREGFIRVWDLESGSIRYSSRDRSVRHLAIGPDNQPLAIRSSDGKLELGDLENTDARQTLGDDSSSVATTSRDGKSLVCFTQTGTVELWDLEDGKLRQSLNRRERLGIGMALSPDGETLAGVTGTTSGGTIEVWDLKSGTRRNPAVGQRRAGGDVAFSPDGKFLACHGVQGITLWDLARGEPSQTLRDSGEAGSLEFSADGRFLAGTQGSSIKVWDLEGGALLQTLAGPSGTFDDIPISPDGKTLVSLGFKGDVINVWDVETGELRRTLGDGSKVGAVALSPDGKTVVSGHQYRRSVGAAPIKLWNLEDGTLRRTLTGHERVVRGVAFSPDGKALVSAGAEKTIRVWDLETGELRHTMRDNVESGWTLAISPDGKTLVSTEYEGPVQVWDLEQRALRHTVSATLRGGPGRVAISPDGRIMATGGNKDGSVKLWDLATGARRQTLSGHEATVASVALGGAGSGETLASGDRDGKIRIWDLESGAEIRVLSGHSAGVASVALGPMGKVLASGSFDRTIKLWDVEAGEERLTLDNPTGYLTSVVISPDGKTLASGDPTGSIRLWELPSGSERPPLEGHEALVKSLAVGRNGELLVSGSYDKTVKVWDLNSGALRRTLTGHDDSVTCVAVNALRGLVAGGSKQGVVKIWDLESGKELHSLAAHRDLVESLAFSPNGRTLVSASGDRSIKTWDVRRGRLRRSLEGISGHVKSLAITADGEVFVSGGEDRSIVLWNLDTDNLDYASYLADGWLTMEGREVTLGGLPADNLYQEREFGFLNVPVSSHLRPLRSGRPGPEIDRALFWAYVRARNWNSALLVLPALVESSTREKAIRHLIGWLEKDTRAGALSSGVTAFRLSQLEARDEIASDPKWNSEIERLHRALQEMHSGRDAGQ